MSLPELLDANEVAEIYRSTRAAIVQLVRRGKGPPGHARGEGSGVAVTIEQAKRFLAAYRQRRADILHSSYLTRTHEHEIEMLNEDIERMEDLIAGHDPSDVLIKAARRAVRGAE